MTEPSIEELTDYEQLTPAMRHVVDALAEGVEPSPALLATLSPREIQEARLLSRTARLTYLSLHQPPVGGEAEAQALRQAQTALAQRPKPPPPPGRGGLLERLRRRAGAGGPEAGEGEIQ